jgi:hypothetical protein
MRGIVGKCVGHCDSVHGRSYDWVINYIRDPFPEHVDDQIQFPQALFVLLGGHHDRNAPLNQLGNVAD